MLNKTDFVVARGKCAEKRVPTNVTRIQFSTQLVEGQAVVLRGRIKEDFRYEND